MSLVAIAIQSPMPPMTQRTNTPMQDHHTSLKDHHQLGLQLQSMQEHTNHTNPIFLLIPIQDPRHPTMMIPLTNRQFFLPKNRPYRTGILYIMHQLHPGVKCMLSTSMKSATLDKMTPHLLNASWWSRRWIDMESIGIANRSTFSMASLATSGHAEMDGLIHGPNRICWPIIGAGITRSQKSIRIKPQLGGTLRRPTTLQPIVYQIWRTQTPSMHRWKIPHPCKFIN